MENVSENFNSAQKTQSNNAKFDPEQANWRVITFFEILLLLPAQPNFH